MFCLLFYKYLLYLPQTFMSAGADWFTYLLTNHNHQTFSTASWYTTNAARPLTRGLCVDRLLTRMPAVQTWGEPAATVTQQLFVSLKKLIPTWKKKNAFVEKKTTFSDVDRAVLHHIRMTVVIKHLSGRFNCGALKEAVRTSRESKYKNGKWGYTPKALMFS